MPASNSLSPKKSPTKTVPMAIGGGIRPHGQPPPGLPVAIGTIKSHTFSVRLEQAVDAHRNVITSESLLYGQKMIVCLIGSACGEPIIGALQIVVE